MTVLHWISCRNIRCFSEGLITQRNVPPVGEDDSSALHPTSSRQTLIHTTLCAFVSTLVAAAAEGPSRVSRLFLFTMAMAFCCWHYCLLIAVSLPIC
jgi:hypothetical protein